MMVVSISTQVLCMIRSSSNRGHKLYVHYMRVFKEVFDSLVPCRLYGLVESRVYFEFCLFM